MTATGPTATTGTLGVMRRRWWRMAAGSWIVLVAGAGMGGCGGNTDKSAPSAAPAAAGGKAGQSAPLAVEGVRQVISTATLRVEVKDVTAATVQAAQLTREAGGFVAGSEETGGPDDRRASVTLKVPGDRFNSLVDAVALLGETRSKQTGTEDITDQVVDLEARLRAGRAAAERLQQLIARSASVAEVVGVEAELAKRTAEIESLEGRLRVLRDRVDLATVTASFSRPQPAADEDLPSFLAGLRGGLRALRTTAIVGSAILGALLPWLAVAGILAAAGRIGWRRWRRDHPPRPKAPPPPSWAAAPPSTAMPLPHPVNPPAEAPPPPTSEVQQPVEPPPA